MTPGQKVVERGRRRASNGEGSIEPRPGRPGQWRARFVVEGRRLAVYGKSRADVVRKRNALLEAHGRGEPLVGASRTVAELLAEWIAYPAESWAPATVAQYRWAVERIAAAPIGRKRVTELTPAHVVAWLEVEARSSTASTLKKLKGALTAALQLGVERGYCARNASLLVRRGPTAARPKAPRSELTPAEVGRLLEAARGDRLEGLVELALLTGARRGELLGLAWSDVDLEAGTLTIRRGLRRAESGGWELGPTKTSSSVRTLELGPRARAALLAHRDRQAAEASSSARRPQSTVIPLERLVFATLDGRPIDPANLRHWWARLLKRAGLSGRVLHELRHTVATYAVASGEPLAEVADMLGHKDPQMLLDTYRHRETGVLKMTSRLEGVVG